MIRKPALRICAIILTATCASYSTSEAGFNLKVGTGITAHLNLPEKYSSPEEIWVIMADLGYSTDFDLSVQFEALFGLMPIMAVGSVIVGYRFDVGAEWFYPHVLGGVGFGPVWASTLPAITDGDPSIIGWFHVQAGAGIALRINQTTYFGIELRTMISDAMNPAVSPSCTAFIEYR